MCVCVVLCVGGGRSGNVCTGRVLVSTNDVNDCVIPVHMA